MWIKKKGIIHRKAYIKDFAFLRGLNVALKEHYGWWINLGSLLGWITALNITILYFAPLTLLLWAVGVVAIYYRPLKFPVSKSIKGITYWPIRIMKFFITQVQKVTARKAPQNNNNVTNNPPSAGQGKSSSAVVRGKDVK